jgi:hypothetical protein
MNSQTRAYIFHVVFPVWIGGMIYLSLRQDPIPFFGAFHGDLLQGMISSWQTAFLPLARSVPSWLAFSLPDALWCYACVSLALVCWRDGPRLFRVFWFGVALTLSLGFELGQGLQIVPGTFCGLDLVFSAAAAALALLATRHSQARRAS